MKKLAYIAATTNAACAALSETSPLIAAAQVRTARLYDSPFSSGQRLKRKYAASFVVATATPLVGVLGRFRRTYFDHGTLIIYSRIVLELGKML